MACASPTRPRLISHRGDSGSPIRRSSITRAGTKLLARIHRQSPVFSGMAEIARMARMEAVQNPAYHHTSMPARLGPRRPLFVNSAIIAPAMA